MTHPTPTLPERKAERTGLQMINPSDQLSQTVALLEFERQGNQELRASLAAANERIGELERQVKVLRECADHYADLPEHLEGGLDPNEWNAMNECQNKSIPFSGADFQTGFRAACWFYRGKLRDVAQAALQAQEPKQ